MPVSELLVGAPVDKAAASSSTLVDDVTLFVNCILVATQVGLSAEVYVAISNVALVPRALDSGRVEVDSGQSGQRRLCGECG